jgi:hypothetical protein
LYNPLLDNTDKLKDQELESRILDLTKKYYIASRMGQGSVANQIVGILEMYKDELMKRQRQSLEKVSKKNAGGLDDLINVD